MGLLDGKTAFITGAARGMGRAHAVRLASEGANIVAADIGRATAEVPYGLGTTSDFDDTVAAVEKVGGTIVGVTADVRSQQNLDEAVARGIERFGQIDICVANAGIFSLGKAWELTEKQWSDMIDINLTGVWRTAKAVLPHMIERRSGSIVLISSICGVAPSEGLTHYTAAKHGVVGLARNIALEAAEFGVRCNVILPGSVDTGMINWPGMYDRFAGHAGGEYLDLRRRGAQYHALAPSDVLDPDDIARAALYLASDLSRAVTGVVLPVDRGHLLLPGANNKPQSWAPDLR